VKGIKSVAFLAIEWYATVDALKIPKNDIKMMQRWIEENKGELSDIYHFVHEHEMEGSKIIYGEQLTENDGNIKIMSYELYILYDVIFIVQSEEKQDSEKQEIVRNSTRLGELRIELAPDQSK
jgi:hypothetical protein